MSPTNYEPGSCIALIRTHHATYINAITDRHKGFDGNMHVAACMHFKLGIVVIIDGLELPEGFVLTHFMKEVTHVKCNDRNPNSPKIWKCPIKSIFWYEAVNTNFPSKFGTDKMLQWLSSTNVPLIEAVAPFYAMKERMNIETGRNRDFHDLYIHIWFHQEICSVMKYLYLICKNSDYHPFCSGNLTWDTRCTWRDLKLLFLYPYPRSDGVNPSLIRMDPL